MSADMRPVVGAALRRLRKENHADETVMQTLGLTYDQHAFLINMPAPGYHEWSKEENALYSYCMQVPQRAAEIVLRTAEIERLQQRIAKLQERTIEPPAEWFDEVVPSLIAEPLERESVLAYVADIGATGAAVRTTATTYQGALAGYRFSVQGLAPENRPDLECYWLCGHGHKDPAKAEACANRAEKAPESIIFDVRSVELLP